MIDIKAGGKKKVSKGIFMHWQSAASGWEPAKTHFKDTFDYAALSQVFYDSATGYAGKAEHGKARSLRNFLTEEILQSPGKIIGIVKGYEPAYRTISLNQILMKGIEESQREVEVRVIMEFARLAEEGKLVPGATPYDVLERAYIMAENLPTETNPINRVLIPTNPTDLLFKHYQGN